VRKEGYLEGHVVVVVKKTEKVIKGWRMVKGEGDEVGQSQKWMKWNYERT
jgi:hypothetical protein